MSTTRRRFLQSSAALAAAPAAAAPLLPTVPLGKHQVTRLVLGANPFYGYSHFNRLFSQHMLEWSTPENIFKTLRACEENGINTWQLSDGGRGLSDIERYRAEGGKIQWMLLSSRRIEEDLSLIPKIARSNPIGIVHHGGTTDRRWRAGEQAKIQEFLKAVRDSGVMVGLSTHNPLVVEEVESRGWDIDFFMTCVYRLTRTEDEIVSVLGQRPLGEVYIPQDPSRMCRAVRQTKKTCLAFKILAAGRLTDSPKQVEQAFRFVFDSIKAQDGVIVGMYPRFSDQVKENADLARRILAKG
ncbi:MAG: hypothetical protein AAB225_05295 [Acidobacteriota bacterium]